MKRIILICIIVTYGYQMHQGRSYVTNHNRCSIASIQGQRHPQGKLHNRISPIRNESVYHESEKNQTRRKHTDAFSKFQCLFLDLCKIKTLYLLMSRRRRLRIISSMNPSSSAGQKVLVDPNDDPHADVIPVSAAEWISLNVGGVVFLTQRNTIANVPGSLLAELTEKSPYYHSASGQYWFDRNPSMFQYILDLYRHGELHFPHSFCGPVIKQELDFWCIDESHVAPCCWNSYREYREQEETLRTLGTAFNDIDRFKRQKQKNTCLTLCFKFRQGLWYFLEDPKSSVFAQIWAVMYVLMIVGSVLTLAFDTHASFRVSSDVNRTLFYTENEKQILIDTTNPHPALYWIEFIISTVFALNLFVRFIVCPRKVHFIKSALNWIDVLVVLSQWATVAIAMLFPRFWEDDRLARAYNMFRLMRICRVFLIFRLARHYTGLRILLLALRASMKEMMLLGVFMTIGMMIFSTLIYYAEFDQPEQYRDIPTGFWWAIVTMTTVGYGDVHPKSPWGYVVGALCALAGMLATGLPIPIIANNFTFYYNVSKMKKMQDERAEVSLSTEVLDRMKSMFRMGGNFVEKMGGKVGDVTSRVTDKMSERATKIKGGSSSTNISEFDNSLSEENGVAMQITSGDDDPSTVARMNGPEPNVASNAAPNMAANVAPIVAAIEDNPTPVSRRHNPGHGPKRNRPFSNHVVISTETPQKELHFKPTTYL